MRSLPIPFAALAAVAALAGCNDPGFRGVSGVRTAEASEVAHCTFLETVTITPSVYGPVLGEQGLRYSRNKVLASAGADGADTVVFDRVEPGATVYEVKAQAYRCGS